MEGHEKEKSFERALEDTVTRRQPGEEVFGEELHQAGNA